MNAEDFAKSAYKNADKDYGVCPPPTDAKTGMKTLIDHFLGEGWYVTLPVSAEQANTEAIYEILKKYPNRKTSKMLPIFRNRMG